MAHDMSSVLKAFGVLRNLISIKCKLMVKSLIAFVREYGDDSRMWCPTAKDIFLATNVCTICELFQDVNGMYHVYVF